MNLSLRSLCMTDLDPMVQLTNDPDVIFFVPGMIRDREGLASWIEHMSSRDHEFVITLDSVPIGECSLTEKQDNTGEIGIMLFPEYWRKGYGTEAVGKLIILAEELKLKTLTATTLQLNEPCIRLFEKLGFSKQAVGWVLDDKIDIQAPLKELYGMVVFEKELQEGDENNDISNGGKRTEKAE